MNNDCISSHMKKDDVTFAQNEQLLYIAGGWERLITSVITADERLIAHGTLGCASQRFLEVQTAGPWGHITLD